MRFLTKFAIALVLTAFALAEPFPPLATVTFKADAKTPMVPAGETFLYAHGRLRR